MTTEREVRRTGGPDLDPEARHRLWSLFASEAERLLEGVRSLPVAAPASPALRDEVASRLRFDAPRDPAEVLADVADLLRRHAVHVTHPRYFGLFNPSVRESAVLGDAVAALFNPQLAVRSHAAAAAELERHVLETLGALLGRKDGAAFFTSGGQEANLCAVAAALARAAPGWPERGVAALAGPATIYVSTDAHDSFVKIARLVGLGTGAIRRVPVDGRFALDPGALASMLEDDRARGVSPLLVCATAGTTACGAVDPLPAIADLAARAGAFFHVDAAYGGLAALSPVLRGALAGIERADSVAWDAHKGLAVPMGAGMFFCRDPALVAAAFGVAASYMPSAADAEPYLSTPQWSRRAIGLKVLFALAELGLPGFARLVEHQARMADALRARLASAGWAVINETPLPVVCFTHADVDAGGSHAALAARVQERGKAWISAAVLGGKRPALRACITSYRTVEEDLDALVAEVEQARRERRSGD